MFGSLSPYKGIEEIAQSWSQHSKSFDLFIVGQSFDNGYGDSLEGSLHALPGVNLVRERLSNEKLGLWLAACDCTVFNYKRILTSGTACLARSLGVPIVLPNRLASIELGEPNSHVLRFDSVEDDLTEKLSIACSLSREEDPDWLRSHVMGGCRAADDPLLLRRNSLPKYLLKVSILIPCHNSERWIRQTIESALAQSYNNKEIIVVDDGSTDNSLEIIRSFGNSVQVRAPKTEAATTPETCCWN